MNKRGFASTFSKLTVVISCWATLSFLVVFSCFSQTAPELRSPENNFITKETSLIFKWNDHPLLTETYQFQLSTSASFTTTITDVQTANPYLLVNGIGGAVSVYFWRVRTTSPVSDWSVVQTFRYFNPGAVSGLTVWLDPTTGVVLNGTKVQQIQDQSGLANNANQGSNVQQPLFVPTDSLINCKPSIKYDGIDDFMEMADNASLDYVDAFTAHTLVRPRVAATNKTILAKWDYQTQGAWAYQTEFAVADEVMFAPCFIITDPGNQKSVSLNADMVSQKPALLTLVYNGNLSNKVRFYKNFNPLLTSLVGTIPSSLPNCSATLKVGKYGGIATRYYDGDIVEVLIYNGDLADSIRNRVDGYLRYKYAPSVDLGNDTIISQNGLCGNLTIKPQGKYQSYTWSNGATTPSIIVTNPGVYGLTVTDFLGNTSSDSIVVYPPHAMNYPSNTQLCEFSSSTWIPGYPSPTYTYLWQNGSTASTFTYNQPGSYHVKITDSFGCFIQSDTVVITLDDYTTTAFLGADTSLCEGNLLALQVGANETQTYLWPDGSTGNQYAVDTTGNYFVESVNVNGCAARDTIHINVVGIAPNAAFSFSNVCDQSVATFTDNSQPVGASPIDAWQWDFGDNTTSAATNPSHTFPAAGEYVVELYVSQGGCGAFRYDTIVIYQLPIVNPEFLGHCQGEAITFVDSNNYFGGGDYLWEFNCDALPQAQQTSFFAVPNRTFDTSGVFLIFCQYIDENGCLDSVSIPLTVDPTPQLQFTFSSACETTPIQFTFTGQTIPNSDFLWSFGGQATSVEINPQHTFSSYGDYTIDLTITNEFLCSDILQENLTIHPVPEPQVELGPYCAGTFMTLIDSSTVATGTISSSTWALNQSDTLFGASQSYLISSLGQQQVELYSVSDNGCVGYLNQFIDVQTELNASFTSDANSVAVGETISFVNTSLGANASLWNLGDGEFLAETNVQYAYGNEWADSTIEVSLIVMNAEGCLDTAFQTISVLSPQIDLEIAGIYLQEQSSFYAIGVQLVNTGSVKLTSANLYVKSEKGQLLAETWQGELSPGEDTIFVFNGQLSLNTNPDNGTQPYLCVSGTGFDASNNSELDLSNNLACKPIGEEDLILMTVAPNPVTDQMHLGIILSTTQTVSIELLNYAGQLVDVLLPSTSLNAGTYNYSFATTLLRQGMYFVRLLGESSEQVQKVLVNN
jgi:PKD repeat protein